MVERGEVWLTELDPTVGSEIQKTRPCVIVSPRELHGVLRTVIIAPMTTGGREAPFRIKTSFQGKTILILPDQIRSVDRSRCVKRIGRLDPRSLDYLLDLLTRIFAV